MTIFSLKRMPDVGDTSGYLRRATGITRSGGTNEQYSPVVDTCNTDKSFEQVSTFIIYTQLVRL
jgi:hypothetical protein